MLIVGITVGRLMLRVGRLPLGRLSVGRRSVGSVVGKLMVKDGRLPLGRMFVGNEIGSVGVVVRSLRRELKIAPPLGFARIEETTAGML